jgi:hypothetical protein
VSEAVFCQQVAGTAARTCHALDGHRVEANDTDLGKRFCRLVAVRDDSGTIARSAADASRATTIVERAFDRPRMSVQITT